MTISLKDFMECVEYNISETSEYMWNCYGPNAMSMDYWNDRHDDGGVSINIVFDKKNQTVYEMQAWDYSSGREYRWIDPDVKDIVEAESNQRGIPFSTSIDDRKFIDLETAEDILDKARAIFLGETYDERIQVPLTLGDDELLQLMRMAHEADMTLNKFVEKVLLEQIEKLK